MNTNTNVKYSAFTVAQISWFENCNHHNTLTISTSLHCLCSSLEYCRNHQCYAQEFQPWKFVSYFFHAVNLLQTVHWKNLFIPNDDVAVAEILWYSLNFFFLVIGALAYWMDGIYNGKRAFHFKKENKYFSIGVYSNELH